MANDSKGATLLVVDDDPTLLQAIVNDLKKHGYSTLAADSAESALKVLQQSRVDLVLSDIRMPGGDGVFLLERVKLLYPGIPVILMTGESEHSHVDCISKGAKQVIYKPFKRSTLMESIKTYLPTTES